MQVDGEKFYQAEDIIINASNCEVKKNVEQILEYPVGFKYTEDAASLYYSINEMFFNLNKLKNKVETAKMNIMSLDQEFLYEYYTAVNSKLNIFETGLKYLSDFYTILKNFFGFNEEDLDEETLKSLYYNFFNLYDTECSTFGVDQGCLKLLMYQFENGSYYKNDADSIHLRNTLLTKYMKEYNMTFEDAYNFLASIDSTGVCSYTSFCNEIYASYIGNEEKFKKDFGFDMYRINAYGEKVLNSEELLADIYLFANLDENGGKLLKNKNGIVTVNYDAWGEIDTSDQIYMTKRNKLSPEVGFDLSGAINYPNEKVRSEAVIDNYLKSHNKNLNYETTPLLDKKSESLKKEIKTGIKENKVYSLSFGDDPNKTNDIIMYDQNNYGKSIDSWEGGRHSVFIVDANERGIVVSSWGEMHTIEWENIEKNKDNLSIQCSKIEGIGK